MIQSYRYIIPFSCSSASNPAYERISDTCSVFNRALRKAFEERKSVQQLGFDVTKGDY